MKGDNATEIQASREYEELKTKRVKIKTKMKSSEQN